MKHSFLYLLVPTLMLGSCSLLYPCPIDVSLEAVSSNIYNLTELRSDDSSIKEKTDLAQGQTDLRVVKDAKDIVYVSLKGYAELIKPYFDTGVSYELDASGYQSTAVFKNKDGEAFYMIGLDAGFNRLYIGGDAFSVVKHNVDYSASSLSLGLKQESQVIFSNKNMASYALPSTYPSTFHEGTAYLPLAYLDIFSGADMDIRHLYSQSGLFQYAEAGQLQTQYVRQNEVVTAERELAQDYPNGMSNSLAEINRDCVTLVLNNLYGLRGLKTGHKNAVSWLRELGDYDNLVSIDPVKRTEALFNVFGKDLDDDHTGVVSLMNTAFGDNVTPGFVTRGPNSIARRAVRDNLSKARAEHFENNNLAVNDIEYSTSGELAVIRFDGFVFAQNAKVDGAVTEEARLTDTAMRIYDQLVSIKAHGGVKKVLFDVSVNGGGVLGVLYKILPMLSKDNSATIAMHREEVDAVITATVHYDGNLDGVYDAEDVFGDDFTFYILNSTVSFSCGNAFPFLAQKNGLAKMVGTRSGGGECTVATGSLPSGHNFQYSSLVHLGWYDSEEGKFGGDEDGCTVDIPLDHADYFNVDLIESKL